MRSPGTSRIIHTRVLSVSDRSSEPTQPFGRSASRANSAFSAAGHCVLTCVFAAFSFMVIAMAFSFGYAQAIARIVSRRNAFGEGQARAGDRRVDERTA